MLELGGGDFPWVGRYQLAAAERRVRAGPGRACARGGQPRAALSLPAPLGPRRAGRRRWARPGPARPGSWGFGPAGARRAAAGVWCRWDGARVCCPLLPS